MSLDTIGALRIMERASQSVNVSIETAAFESHTKHIRKWANSAKWEDSGAYS